MAWLVATLVAAHALAPEDYWVASHTLSDLGAQDAENAFVSRAGFIGFGVLLAWHYSGDLVLVRRAWAQALLLLLYGSTIALTGVFSTAPLDGFAPSSEPEALLHAIFSILAGTCLSGAILIGARRAQSLAERWRHFAALGCIVLMAALFVAIPEYRGITQRILWVGALWWIGWASTEVTFVPVPRDARDGGLA
jgi:hypothetical membrane protein